jgi:NADPH:quinone reductase and related Zn-dependent oxidoreductases
MRAIRYTEYGSADVARLVEIDRPVPKDDEVLIQVHAASVNAMDRHFMRGEPLPMRLIGGLRRPKDNRMGFDVAGRVEAVGKDVTEFKQGDEIFGVSRGAFAEYACPQASRIALKPPGISFEQAAATPIACSTALQGLRDKGHVTAGQNVLVNGAGGGVGTFAVQVAKILGAEVTAVTSTANLDIVSSLGADKLIDYTREDFTKGGRKYDVIFDIGATHSWSDIRRALTKEGQFLFAGAATSGGWSRPLGVLLSGLATSLFVSQKLKVVSGRVTAADLVVIAQYLASGQLKPSIVNSFPLKDAAFALRQIDEGRARGKTVIVVD